MESQSRPGMECDPVSFWPSRAARRPAIPGPGHGHEPTEAIAMTPRDPLLNMTEALLRATEHHPPPASGLSMPPSAAFTIALSRETGAGGTFVAREVGRRLNWPVYDHELLEQLARELRVGVSQLRAVDEQPANWVQEWA